MAIASPDVTAALASLRDRWGAAAPRRMGGEVVGALATVPLPDEMPLPGEMPLTGNRPGSDDGRIVRTGFAALDAILGPGGVPREASLALRGDHSSGKTTLALRLAAEAQAGGAIVAWLDLARSLDPVEAVARGVRLEWLVVLSPVDLDEGLAMAGALLQARAVDLLIADFPADRRPAPRRPRGPGPRAPGPADRLHRLAALARRAGTLLVVLEPPGLASDVTGALAESMGLRLELARRSWIRLGRDVVGQTTEVVVARNRFGPPGRRADLRILYAEGGERDSCLAREPLLREIPLNRQAPVGISHAPTNRDLRTHHHATAPPPLAAPPSPPRPIPLHILPARTGGPGRPALDGGLGPRREPGSHGAGRPARDASRERTPARA